MAKTFTQDDMDRSYDTGLRNGQEHSQSSPETLKMVGELKVSLATYEQQMKDLIQKVDEGFSENSKQHKEIMEVVEKAVKGKANKWTEDLIRGVLWAIGLGLLGTIGTIVIQAIIHFNQ